MSRTLLTTLLSASAVNSSASAGPLTAIAQGVGSIQPLMEANWLAFGVCQFVVAASGILPAAVVAMMAGASFGLWGGIAISASTTILGGWVAFLLSRSLLRPWIARWIGESRRCLRWDEAVGRESWRFVLLLRISPVMPFAPTSYALGLTSIDQRSYLLGTLASLPALVGYVALGALGQQSLSMAAGTANFVHWTLLGAGFVIVIIALARVREVLGNLAEG